MLFQRLVIFMSFDRNLCSIIGISRMNLSIDSNLYFEIFEVV